MTLRRRIANIFRRAADRLDRNGKLDMSGLRKAAAELEVSPGHLSRVLRGLRPGRELLDRYNALKNGSRNPKNAEANTHRRHAEVGAFLQRNRHITDFNRLAEIAVNEGLYSPKTSKCDIASRLERFESLHPELIAKDQLKFRELLKS